MDSLNFKYVVTLTGVDIYGGTVELTEPISRFKMRLRHVAATPNGDGGFSVVAVWEAAKKDEAGT